jgi:HTH-type transcriptional regulator/antitoxin MqsA
MVERTCAGCGGRVTSVTGPLSVELRGETVTVPDVEHERCAQCGEAFLSLTAADQLQREAVAHLREARGLLTPDQIRSLRRSLGVSQAALERLLGVGSKTVVRWERGTVFQSATADRLMRLLIAKPELVSLLSGEAPRRRSHAAGW